MDASSLLLVALSSRDVSDDVPPLTARDLWTVIQASDDRQISLSALFGDEDSWRSVLAPGLHEAAAARLALADVADGADCVVSDLRENGIWVSSPFEDSWPHRLRTRLKAHAPVVLYGAGDASLLAVDGIGIVGSRNLDPEGEDVARQLAATAVNAGMTVVSSGARGADQTAMSTAMGNGGRAVGVLAHPLDRNDARCNCGRGPR